MEASGAGARERLVAVLKQGGQNERGLDNADAPSEGNESDKEEEEHVGNMSSSMSQLETLITDSIEVLAKLPSLTSSSGCTDEVMISHILCGLETRKGGERVGWCG